MSGPDLKISTAQRSTLAVALLRSLVGDLQESELLQETILYADVFISRIGINPLEASDDKRARIFRLFANSIALFRGEARRFPRELQRHELREGHRVFLDRHLQRSSSTPERLVGKPGSAYINHFVPDADILLDGLELKHTHLTDIELPGASLIGTRLDGASLINAYLENASFENASLVRADLTNARARGACFSNAHLIGATLIATQLSGANLERALLMGADCTVADFGVAVLLGTDFSGAQLRGAHLWAANFDGDTKLTREQILATRQDTLQSLLREYERYHPASGGGGSSGGGTAPAGRAFPHGGAPFMPGAVTMMGGQSIMPTPMLPMLAPLSAATVSL